MTKADDDWFGCPVCGEQVRMNALACPHCGSDEETGWSADTEYDGMDLPVDDEWPVNRGPARRRKGISILVTLLMIGLLFFLLLARY